MEIVFDKQKKIVLLPSEVTILKTSALDFLEKLKETKEESKPLYGRLRNFFQVAPVFMIADFMQFVTRPVVGYSDTFEAKGKTYWISGDARLGKKSFDYFLSKLISTGLTKERIDELSKLNKKEFGRFTYELKNKGDVMSLSTPIMWVCLFFLVFLTSFVTYYISANKFINLSQSFYQFIIVCQK